MVENSATRPPDRNIHIPSQADWQDYGTIFQAGAAGEWDTYLWGGFAFCVIKNDDVYYLYYQGASDYRTEYDETVLWRAIGVATSTDGIHFTKYKDNPVLTWFPTQNGEEGAVSCGVTQDASGEIILYYGANTQESRTTVRSDARVATSSNGLMFVDRGTALESSNKSVWGSGDEIFPVDAIFNADKWVVFYIPNGTAEGGMLGIAYGSEFNTLDESHSVTNREKLILVWGTAGHAQLDEDSFALILNNVREKRTEVRLFSWQSPEIMSDPVAVYQFDDIQQAVLLLDKEKGTWFMYYRTYNNSYGVKIAASREGP
jgi:hypothetical protein